MGIDFGLFRAISFDTLVRPIPRRKIALPRAEHQEHLYLEPSQVETLAAAIVPMFEAQIYSAVYLGCRWGELDGLKRQNLNLLRRKMPIVGTLEEVGGSPPRYVEETKTKSGPRTSRSRRPCTRSLLRISPTRLKASSCSSVKSEVCFEGTTSAGVIGSQQS